ncbi:MAG TPA: Spy/CpxP family protein refolding chaperone [Pyrinomonadaceae bacterium]|nr:Spy/CpxP family protein refolding chaperone [Pyrinomonadaceae bacterium]
MKLNWKKFSVVATFAGALLLTTAAVVFSQNPPPRPDGPPGPPRGPFGHGPHGPRGPGGFGPLAGLNLTDAQKEQVKQIHESFAEQTKALRDQMHALHESQGDPMSNFNEAAVRSAAEARAKVQVEMEVAHAKMMSQVANVLTAEQRAQMAERHKHRRQGPPRPPAPPGEPEF